MKEAEETGARREAGKGLGHCPQTPGARGELALSGSGSCPFQSLEWNE